MLNREDAFGPAFEVRRNALRERLLRWFDAHQRPLPWRTNPRPYAVWISEIMLQQTQVKTMLPYYERWMERFPDVRSVAEAPEEEILKHWEGLGYYSRATGIQKTARILLLEHGGEFPRNRSKVLKLPGIGPYTAGAILSMAFNLDEPTVDGNIERVLARLFDIATPVKELRTRKLLWETARELLPPGAAGRFNQALMDLGAMICVPKRPLCGECPLADLCESRAKGVETQRPVTVRREAPTPVAVAVGVLMDGGKIFIQKRPPTGLMPNLWEFPGGKLQEGESPKEALVREFREELGIEIGCIEDLCVIRHNYTTFKVTLHAMLCRFAGARREPVLRAATEGRWVAASELDDFAFPAANRKLIGILEKRGRKA